MLDYAISLKQKKIGDIPGETIFETKQDFSIRYILFKASRLIKKENLIAIRFIPVHQLKYCLQQPIRGEGGRGQLERKKYHEGNFRSSTRGDIKTIEQLFIEYAGVRGESRRGRVVFHKAQIRRHLPGGKPMGGGRIMLPP